jgi:hypothetical protein
MEEAKMHVISPISDWESRLLFVGRGCSWNDVIKRLRGDAGEVFSCGPLLGLAEAIAQSPFSSQLFPGISMFNLVVSDTADFRSVNGVLHIAYRSDVEQFVFHHIAINLQQEYCSCSEARSFGVFKRLVWEKFMIACAACNSRFTGSATLEGEKQTRSRIG